MKDQNWIRDNLGVWHIVMDGEKNTICGIGIAPSKFDEENLRHQKPLISCRRCEEKMQLLLGE